MEIFETLKQRSVKTGLAVGLGLTMLVGCGADGPDITPNVAGTVVGHEYDDADTWTSFIMAGKVLVPITHHDDEHYYLKVNQCGHPEFMEGENGNEAGCGIFTQEVSKQDYQSYPDGSTITFNENE